MKFPKNTLLMTSGKSNHASKSQNYQQNLLEKQVIGFEFGAGKSPGAI